MWLLTCDLNFAPKGSAPIFETCQKLFDTIEELLEYIRENKIRSASIRFVEKVSTPILRPNAKRK